MNPERGFTLVEVLVALVVAVAALALLSQGFVAGGRASVASQNVTRAALLARKIMTEFETGALPLSHSSKGDFTDPPGFRFETASAAHSSGLAELTIAIRWTERSQERVYELVRLMRERPAP